ncbi:MAG: hypothetical protein ABW088_00195 [Sedimenticola sp.]
MSLPTAIKQNEQLKCSASGCNEKRNGMSRWCNHHKRRNEKYGSPKGTSLRTVGGGKRYDRELEYCHQLIIKNSDSKPVQAAVKLIGQWLKAAKGGLEVPGSRLLCLIDEENVELRILEELSAVWIHALEVKRQGDRELTFSLANALYSFVPKSHQWITSKNGKTYAKAMVKIGSRDRETMGEYIKTELGVFLENIRQHFTASEQQQTSLKRQMAGPL